MINKILSLFKTKSKCGCSKLNQTNFSVLETAVSQKFTLKITEGCLICNACETTCPKIFDVVESGVRLRVGHRDYLEQEFENIKFAVDGCPCEVLKLEIKI